jgi:plastocyanin
VTRRPRRSIAAVAAVAVSAILLVACGGGGGGGGSGAYQPPKGPATQTLSIDAQNFSFTPKDPTIAAGITNLKLTSKGGIHTFVFDHGKYPGFQLEASGDGDSQSEKIDLKPGKYTFYCNIPTHRAAGMEGTLTVTG